MEVVFVPNILSCWDRFLSQALKHGISLISVMNLFGIVGSPQNCSESEVKETLFHQSHVRAVMIHIRSMLLPDSLSLTSVC